MHRNGQIIKKRESVKQSQSGGTLHLKARAIRAEGLDEKGISDICIRVTHPPKRKMHALLCRARNTAEGYHLRRMGMIQERIYSNLISQEERDIDRTIENLRKYIVVDQ